MQAIKRGDKMKKITVEQLVKRFSLEVLGGESALVNEIESEDLHRPGLELTGFFDFFPFERIHLLGKQEFSYIFSLCEEERRIRMREYIEQKPPCVIITRGQEGLENLALVCESEGVPLLRTTEKTTEFMGKLHTHLRKELAREIGVHGVCVNVFGVGILIRGTSGIGKSEVALELIKKGHRLISDDLVILKQIGPEALIATHNGNNRDFLALRGVGLVDITRLYGSGACQEETKVNMDLLLSPWDSDRYYDAMGVEKKTVQYIDTKVEHIEIPIRPGRDISTLIEVAAKNWRLEQNGYDALAEFNERLKDQW